MASNDDMVARISAAVSNALRNSQQQVRVKADSRRCVVFRNVEMSCQGVTPARHTDDLDVCRTLFVREKPVKTQY